MLEDLRDYLSKLCFWRLPTAEGKITRIEIDRVSGRVLIYYQFSLGEDGPYTGLDHAESDLPLTTKNLGVGDPVTVRYRRSDPGINELDRDLTYISLTKDL